MMQVLVSLGFIWMKVLHNNILVWSFLISTLSSCVNSPSGGMGVSNSGREEEHQAYIMEVSQTRST